MKNDTYVFDVVTDASDHDTLWEAYFQQFGAYQRDRKAELIQWFADGDGQLLRASDSQNPDNWVAWMLFAKDNSESPNRENSVLLGYYLIGKAIDAQSPASDIELFLKTKAFPYLADAFGSNAICIGEIENDFDRSRYEALGLTLTDQVYAPPLLHGEDGEQIELTEPVTYTLAVLRLAADETVSQEGLEELVADLDEIYGISVEAEPVPIPALPEEAEQRLAPDLENPPRA